MFYDLNIAWSPATPPAQLLATLSLASSLGYATVALNHTLTSSDVKPPPFPSLPPPSSSTSTSSKLPAVLHRATLPLSSPAASTYRIPQLAAFYDILAVRPSSADAFQNACLVLDVAIISLDLTQRLDFHFRPKPCMAAVARGLRFEICYAQALAADPRGRATFIANATNLIRATRGRGIILSSEASSALALRAPADVVNLLAVWGLGNDKGMDGLRSIPRSVVVNEGIKRNGFRGVIQVIEAAKKPLSPPDQEPGGKNNQKRKNASQDDGTSTISKRQMKKMRLAARAGAEASKK